LRGNESALGTINENSIDDRCTISLHPEFAAFVSGIQFNLDAMHWRWRCNAPPVQFHGRLLSNPKIYTALSFPAPLPRNV